MPSALPGLGLIGDWTNGEDDWGDDMNFALLALSALAGKALDSITDALPDPVSNGTILVDTSVGPTEGFIAIGHNDEWSYVAPEFGWTFYVRDEARFATYTVSGWVWTPFEVLMPYEPTDGGKVLAVNGDADGVEWIDLPGAELPSYGEPQAGLVLAVNEAGDGLEWVDPGDTGSELPAIGTGDAGKVLAVNDAEDGVEWIDPPSGGGPDSVAIGMFAAGGLGAAEVLATYVAAVGFTLPASLTGTQAHVGTAGTVDSTTISVRRNGTEVGTIQFAVAATTGTFTMASEAVFSAGDRLSIVAPTPANATLADLSVTFLGSL